MSETISFDPSALGKKDANIFGLPFTCEMAQTVIIPVPWEVTVSYHSGTAQGPQAIFDASFQVDLYDPELVDAWKFGVAMEPLNAEVVSMNNSLRKKAERYIDLLVNGEVPDKNRTMAAMLAEINAGSVELNDFVQRSAEHWLDRGKIPALIGGDHSTPLGLIRALAQRHDDLGILHIDAHSDLRDAYEGFTYSHASIMFNVLRETTISKLVQVGIRDYCEDEVDIIDSSEGRVKAFFDRDLKEKAFEGISWKQICNEIVEELPRTVYFSFDIDGLDPRFCPGTGTPVPGGLDSEQVLYLLKLVVNSGRKIVGFDINEVAPGEGDWDANVASRILYRITNLVAKSNGLKPLAVSV